jgi:hypothetical protein
MNSGGWRFALLPVAAALGLAGAPAAPAQSAPAGRGRAIQFSEPRSPVVSSNVNSLGANKTRLEDLEQDLRKPFDFLGTADNSINRLAAPPVRPPPPSAARLRQMKELLEKRKEWIFLAPEEYVAPGLTAEEIFDLPEYGPDGEPRPRKTPIERYYERLDKARAEARAAATNRVRDDFALSPLAGDAGQDDRDRFKGLGLTGAEPSVPGLDAWDKALRGWVPSGNAILNPTPSSSTGSGGGLGDLFGLGKPQTDGFAPDRSRAMDERMQEFKKLLETSSPTALNPVPGAFSSAPIPPAIPPGPAASAGQDPFGSAGLRSGVSPLAANPAPLALSPGSPANPALPGWLPPPSAAPAAPALKPPSGFNIPQRNF